MAIQHCNEEDNGNWDWGGCKNDPVNDTSITKLANDACDSYCSTTLWVGASSIAAYAVSRLDTNTNHFSSDVMVFGHVPD